MASGGAEEDDGGTSLDIDNIHMLLQVEHEQIQRRTFTNWINAQLSKRCPPTFVSDIFTDLRDGSQLLNLLEVMSGQPMKRQKGRGVFQQRANIETALNFLKKKSIKLVNINISDITEGRPSIILGLIWTIILHCHIEELASTLSFSSCHSSMDSLASLDSWSSSPVPASPVPGDQASPLHRRFRVSAKKALLMWVRDQCKRVGCSVSVRDFRSSWRSGEAFLAILCSLRPQLVDLSLVRSRSNQENLEEAFLLAERELHIPRLLEPHDVDVPDPDEKSIVTYVAQFLQYSNDMPAPEDHLQVSSTERTVEVTSWLQQAHQELSESWTAAEKLSFAEKYQVLEHFTDSFTEQRRPVMTLLAAVKRRPELSREQSALRTAWDRLEEELQRCREDLDSSLPPPLDSVAVWLQRAEATLADKREEGKDHADAAKDARSQQDNLKTLVKDMSHYINIADTFPNMDDMGNTVVPLEKFNELKRRLTDVRVTAKYQGIKLEYQELRHTVLDLLQHINAKVQTWKAPYRSQEAVLELLKDWHESVERQGLLGILMDTLQNLKDKANAYSSKAALAEDSQRVTCKVKAADRDTELVTQAVMDSKGTMERVVSAWETYNNCMASLQTWLAQKTQSDAQIPLAETQDMSEWTSCQAKLNEVGNLLIEVTESSTSLDLAQQLSRVNMQWAEFMKRTMFEVASKSSASPPGPQMMQSSMEEVRQLLRQPLEVSAVSLTTYTQKLQLLRKKMADVEVSSAGSSPESHTVQKEKQALKMLAAAERTCEELHKAACRFDGRLAELDRWSTESLDCLQRLKEKKNNGGERSAKVLFAQGLQLESQVVNEGQDLLDIVSQMQETSPLHDLSTSILVDRISGSVSRCKEILEMFNSIGFQRHVEKALQTTGQTKAGLCVVARTKHTDQVANVVLQKEMNQQKTGGLLHSPENQETKDQLVVHHVNIQTLPQLSEEPEHYIHSPLDPSLEKFEPMIQPELFSKSHTQALSLSPNDDPLSAPKQHTVGAKDPKSPHPEEKGGSSTSQTHTPNPRIRVQPNTSQNVKSSPHPPVMSSSEIHSRAQSMARSRLEKARFHLKGRIQQAIKLFGGKEISVSNGKRKQKALKILQPAILEEFLGAVEGFGAFCTGSHLQDLLVLSESVRNQWEDVRREIAAFVPIFWSQIRQGEQCFSVVQCEAQANALHEATDLADTDSLLHPQAIKDGHASEECVESLQQLCDTLAPIRSSCLATDQLRKSDEGQETQPSATVLPYDCRGRQLQGNTPPGATSTSTNTWHSKNVPLELTGENAQQDLLPGGSFVSARPCQSVPQSQSQDISTKSEGDLKPNLKSSLRSEEQFSLLNVTESHQQTQSHVQAVVSSSTLGTKQEAEWTIIAATTSQEEDPSRQEVQDRYTRSRLAFQSQLQKNRQHLEKFITDGLTTSALQRQEKQLQTLKRETETLWFELELQYTHLSQSFHLMTREQKEEVEKDWKYWTQQWRDHQMCLQSRMTSIGKTADMIVSADDQIALITEKLERILGESVDISSFTLADSRLVSDLKEMDDRLQFELNKISEQGTEKETQRLDATSASPLCLAPRDSVHHLERLGQQLARVESAAQALDHFLATVREVKADNQTLLDKENPGRQQSEADRERENQSWQAAMQQRLHAAAEQSERADSFLKAAGMTLSVDGVTVTCQDVVTLLPQKTVDVEKELMRARQREREAELLPLLEDQIQEHGGLIDEKIRETKSRLDSLQEHLTPRSMEEESDVEAKRRRLEEDNDPMTQRKEEEKNKTLKSDYDGDQRRRSSVQVRREGKEKESPIQRRLALLASLREIKEAAEQLGLQEPTLPAVQQRTRALTELESVLAGHLPELQLIKDASPQSVLDLTQSRELKDAWEEATKAITERLEQCHVLVELLKKFQHIGGELSRMLQKAESTISGQATYMGKENLHRLHQKVQETKVELSGLGNRIEEVRSVCRQLHAHLRRIPECNLVPFEGEADALMDRWLDVSERTDSHAENLYLSLTLWDGVLQLAAEVESLTASKLSVFAQSPSFNTEEDIRTLRSEIVAQEEKLECFHKRASEIQALLQSTEPPLELQVVETQTRKKMEQLKELVSDAEEVYQQMVATKEHISVKMAEGFTSLQKIQDSLLTLSGSDVPTVLAKLKDLLFELQTQEEQVKGLLQDVRVLTSMESSLGLESLPADGIQLQDKVKNTYQLFSEVEEQTERNIQALHRLKIESELFEQWLQATEERATKKKDLRLLQEEALQQRGRSEVLNHLLSSLQSSPFQQSAPVTKSRKLLERYNNLCSSSEMQTSVIRDIKLIPVLSEPMQRRTGKVVKTPPSRGSDHQSLKEQELHSDKSAVCSPGEGETGDEENILRHDGDDLKEDAVKTDEHSSRQAAHHHDSAGRELTSDFLTQRQEACRLLEELKHTYSQIPTLFPWPGAAERTQTCLQARQLQDEAESLQFTLTCLTTHKESLADRSSAPIWKDPSLDELESRRSSLLDQLKVLRSRLTEDVSREEHFSQLLHDCRHKLTSLQERMSLLKAQNDGQITDVTALEGLLQELTDMDKDLLEIGTLKDSIAVSSTSEARVSLSQQVGNLQNHKRALDSSIRDRLTLLTGNSNQSFGKVEEEVSCVQTALKDVADVLLNVCEGSEALPGIRELKQTWHTIQDCDAKLTKLAAKLAEMKKTEEESITQQMISAAVGLAVDAATKDLDSLRSSFLEKKQQLAENAANTLKQVISQLQKWSHTVQSETSSPSKASLDEGLWLQQTLHDMISDREFLLNCLGANMTEKLEESASGVLNESTQALANLSKHTLQVSKAPCEEELPKILETRRESSTTPAVCSSISSQARATSNSRSDQNGNNTETTDTQETNKNAPVHQFLCKDIPDDSNSQQLKSPQISLNTCLWSKDDTGMLDSDNNPLISEQQSRSGVDTEPLRAEPLLTFNSSLMCQPECNEPHQEVTAIQGVPEKTAVGSPTGKETDNENVSGLKVAQPQTSPKAGQKNNRNGSEMISQYSQGAELCETGLDSHFLSKSSLVEESPPALSNSDLEKLKCASAKLSCKENTDTCELVHGDVLNSQELCGEADKLTGARAAGTTLLHINRGAMTDFCHAEERTMSSALNPVEGEAFAESGVNKQLCIANAAQSAGTENSAQEEEINPEAPGEVECCRPKALTLPGRGGEGTEPEEESQLEVVAPTEDAETEGSMESLAAVLPARETAGGSPATHEHKCSMMDVLSEIQSLVERSNIINRAPHIDLNWYLRSSPGEPEIQLTRTIQKVLACRYQPARLDVPTMAQQLKEAEDYRRSVQEQVSTMKSMMASRFCDPETLKRVEGQWSAALLDASATVQVKATQLTEVQEYHKQMRIIRAFLEVLASEKEKWSLHALGSSALQADKLHVLLQTMAQKKEMMEELLHLSSQLSVHLSDAESSGALLAQLGDVQEEWRLLEGSIKRALQHASSSNCQYSLLIKDAEQLKAKLEAIQRTSFQSCDSKSTFDCICLASDLKLYNQLYLHLQSQSDALVHFSLGQKEKDEIKRSLQELASLLNVTRSKLNTSTYRYGGISTVKTNKHLQDLIIWAKQAENHIFLGQKLALFPEEARMQMVEMKKFQSDFLSRRYKMQSEVQQMKNLASSAEKKGLEEMLETTEDLYKAVAENFDLTVNTMKTKLEEREKVLRQLANVDAWLAETQAKTDPCSHVDSVSKADIRNLKSELKSHKLATLEIENQLKVVETLMESCQEIVAGLSPGESRYLVNRLSGLWTELDGLLAHVKATSWELEELILERTSADEELANIQTSLHKISTDLEQQRFPLTQETVLTIERLKHMLMEHQCEVQELQHCQEAKRSSILCTIGELQDQCKALSVNAFEQDKYMHLRRQMEESRDIAEEQIQRAKDKTTTVGERFKLCQTLLVELPLVKTQCQEAADQLEAIAQELCQPELEAERQRISGTVETLVSWEHSVTSDIKILENKLLLGLCFSSEYPALMELFQRIRAELEGAQPVNPNEKSVDSALRRHWVIWRNIESGMRVLEGLGEKEKIDLKNHKQLYWLKDSNKKECHLQMESLSQARESLKDYQWAAQGAIGFLHNAEATFLTAPGGFLDCTEEQRQTQQALEALEDGFQAHISHLSELLPQQPCLSRPVTEQLHFSLLSQLLVGRAVLEAQAQLRLESLQRCEMRQQSHKKCHEDVRQCLLGLETKVSECAAEQVTSYEKCVGQQNTARLLMKDLCSLTGKIEELRAGCPMQGCGVGKDGELGALWRRWVLLRRAVSLLMAHTQQREEEWKDITTSIQQCCGFLASLQADVPDSSSMTFTSEEPQELLAQAEMHQAGLEQEQQALASLEHRLEHALSLSSSQDPISQGPVGKTLVKIQENVRSLKERNLLVVAAAHAEERGRQQVQEEIGEVEQHILAILPLLEASSDQCKKQELMIDLSSQKAKLKRIRDGLQSRYTEIPADINIRLQEVQLSLQKEEEKLMNKNNPVRKLESQMAELGSSLGKVNVLLEQRSPTVSEAQRALKHVWDELDRWHSCLMLLENEVQDLAEDHPAQAHLLMDQLTQPLQLYQNAAQMAEQRTAFLSKIPTCLQEFEGIVYSATCWLDEAQSWLSAPCCFTTARNLQNHANSLQLVLDDSERIRNVLLDFSPVLDEISAVCDMSSQQEKLEFNDKQVHKMQRKILKPLQHLLEAVVVVEEIEAELKTIEKNVPKIRTILSSVDNSDIPLREHLHNRQVILANVQSMRRTLDEMERCKAELQLPQGAVESLLVFSRVRLLLQELEELERLTEQQAKLLEDKMSEGDRGTAGVSDAPEWVQQLESLPQRNLLQGAYEVPNSEEEEDEENKSYHSSSSDTLTCSIPEDPEETLHSSDVHSGGIAEIMPLSEEKVLVSRRLSFETKMMPQVSETEVSELENVQTGFPTPDFKADDDKTLIPDYMIADLPITSAGVQFTASTLNPPEPEALVGDPRTKSLQVTAVVEDTRLIPLRPTTPFTATKSSSEFIEEVDGDMSSSVGPLQDLKQNEGNTSQSVLVEEFQQVPESSEVAAGQEDNEEQLKWSRLHSHISQKLITLKKVVEEHQARSSSEDGEIPEKELISTGSASAALKRTQESISMLRQIRKNAAEGLHPDKCEEFYKAVWSVLLCLDALTDLLLTPGDAGKDDNQLRMLQQECVSTELLTLAELLSKVETDTTPELSAEQPQALCCVTSLRECLNKVQLVLNTHRTPGITSPHQELSDVVHIFDSFQLGQQEKFPALKDAPGLKRCVLGRHLRESPGDKAKLQQASRSLLQGITHLVELGEECITEGQTSQVHSRGRLQAVLCRREKLLQVLRSQLAFVQNLFQREPESLRCQEDEWVQLEARAKALQYQALEQEVASQRRIQEWTRWEDDCGRLSRLLDDVEAFISSGEPEASDEKLAEHRLDACQQTLVKLDECRAVLGQVIDRWKVLQSEPEFGATVGPVGGALELRWQSASMRAEREVQRCSDIQDSQLRFQNDFALLSEWLTGSSKLLKTWSNLANTSDLNKESLYTHLIKLLDFSVETEAMSAKKASASKEATQLFNLREDDCSVLRAEVDQMEADWSKLTSDLCHIQEQLQQNLLAAWPPVELLSDLRSWLKQLGSRLSQKKESVLKARNAAQITDVLQNFHNTKAGMMKGQLLIDFLSQPGPQVVGVDVQETRHKHTKFAEELGDLSLQWLHQQRELESQIRDAEQMHGTCADRERRLQRLCRWIEQQQKQLNQSQQPTCQTVAHKTLLELEAVGGRVSEVAAALQELKATRVHARKGKAHPCDLLFSAQTDAVCHACGDLRKQMEDLRPALQQALREWDYFERVLRDVSLHTTRVHCSLQHPPLFSLKQAEGHMDFLELLQEETRKGDELWASVDKSCQSLVKIVHQGIAQCLEEQMEKERKRWKDVVQELKNEQRKTKQTLSLWREYSHLLDQCSLQLQQLWRQCEDLWSSSPQQDTQAVVHSAEQLQEAAKDLQSRMGDVLLASKALMEKLETPAANLIQSESRLLSRDIMQLQQGTSGKIQSLKEELEEQKLFDTRLELLEKETMNNQNELAALNSADCLKVLSELSAAYASLFDVREMSGSATFNSRDAERVHMLSRQWAKSMTHMFERNRELQAERQHSQSFQQMCESLTSVQKRLEEELTAQSYSSTQKMLTVHQRLQAEVIIGHQLLQDLLRHVVHGLEKESEEKRPELVAQAACVRKSWFHTVDLVGQHRALIKEQLSQWTVYREGLKRLRKLLGEVDPLLPPTGPLFCALHQEPSCYQCVEDALSVHSDLYSQTLEVGRHLCETTTEPECRSRLQLELQGVQEAWERTTSVLKQRRDLHHTSIQKWSQCQETITSIMTELEELGTALKQPLPGGPQGPEDERITQESELSLQRLASGLRDFATMKTDLSQYVAAGDSALLEQQLEQLHGQWEELCLKVSLRRQEIADRLNAWTIFNDKNKEFCDWLTQMENKVCRSGDLSIEEMVEKLKKDCMEEINLFSENKSHLKQLGEQLLLASDEAKQTQVRGSLQEVNQRWHNLFHHIEARVKKLKETLVTVQQLDKNMSNLRSWLCRIEAELSRPITYSVCHHQEIQKRLAEQQELQRDIEQHTEGVASVLSLCDVLLRDEDAAGGTEAECDSLQETSRSLDQRWRTICAMALDRRLRIEETWRLWCKFLDDYSRFEDWLKMAERSAANPNSADVLYTVAKEELKKFEGFQRQVHERLTQLELVNNQYRRLARENRTDRASQLKAMVHEGNRRWDTLYRRVAAILRRLKHFTSQREEFEGTRENMLVWLTELDLQLTNVEHFSESDVHHKILQLNSFQKEITLNTERIDGLIVFGEGLIQRSSPQDAALIEDELEELHSYCQEVFSRLVRFHQRLSQPPMEEPELSGTTFSLETSLELINRPWVGRGLGSLPATPTHLLACPLERSGRETPMSVDSLPLEWDHTGDVGGSSSHEDDEEDEGEEEGDDEEERAYFSALSEVELTEGQEEFVEAPQALRASSLVSSTPMTPPWKSQTLPVQLNSEGRFETPPPLTSAPVKQGYLRLMTQCSGSLKDIKRVSLILDDDVDGDDDNELPEELGLTVPTASEKQSGVIERWELLQAQSRSEQHAGSLEPQQLTSDLNDITTWLETVIPALENHQKSDSVASVEDMTAKAKDLKEMHKMFTRYKSIMLSINLRAQEAPELQDRLGQMNRDWSRACTSLQQWDTSLRKTLMRCQEFHESLHSLLLWLAHAESRRYTVDISHPDTSIKALQQHHSTLTDLREELQCRQGQQASLHTLWSQLQPEEEADDCGEAREKLHVTGSKLKLLLRQVDQDLGILKRRLDCESGSAQGVSAAASQEATSSKKDSSPKKEKRDPSPRRSFFHRVLRAAFPLHLLLLFLLLLPCLIPMSESVPGCTGANNFARSFYPMLHYTNGPPPT